MKAEFQMSFPEELEATVTLQATVGDFIRLRNIIRDEWKERFIPWPLSDLAIALTNVITQAEKHFAAEKTTQP